MANEKTTQHVDIELKKLETRVDELIYVCEKLTDENHLLRTQKNDLHADRNQLRQKNDIVKTRVEAMISRLRSMEKSH